MTYRAVADAGLALFAVVAWKVLFSDLTDLLQVYRIVAFILLGLLVLSGSFVYLKYRPVPPAVKRRGGQNMTAHAGLPDVAGLALPGTAAEPASFRFSKAIDSLGRPAASAILGVALDTDVYASTRDGFPDLRIFDAAGKEVPCLVERDTESAHAERAAAVREHAWFPCTSRTTAWR